MKKVKITSAVRIMNRRVQCFDGAKEYLPTGGIAADNISTEQVTYDTKPSRADLYVQENQLIVARMKDTNKVLLIDGAYCNVIVSTGFLVLETMNGWVPRFLYHYLRSINFQIQKNRLCTGATQKAINNGNFGKIEIPEISPTDQQRIVRILDKADSLRQKRKQAIELLDDYLKSVFMEMFGDPIRNPKRLRTSSIEEMGSVVTGNTPSRKITSNYGHFIEWIKSDNINNNLNYVTHATEHLSEQGAKKGRVVPSGAILVTCIAGSLDCIGNASMIDRRVAFNQQINAIIPHADIEQTFLYSQILLNKTLFRDASTNSMKGMLNKKKFSNIRLLNPNVSLQKKFSKVFSKTDLIKMKMLTQSKELETQFQALLQKAFKGEL